MTPKNALGLSGSVEAQNSTLAATSIDQIGRVSSGMPFSTRRAPTQKASTKAKLRIWNCCARRTKGTAAVSADNRARWRIELIVKPWPPLTLTSRSNTSQIPTLAAKVMRQKRCSLSNSCWAKSACTGAGTGWFSNSDSTVRNIIRLASGGSEDRMVGGAGQCNESSGNHTRTCSVRAPLASGFTRVFGRPGRAWRAALVCRRRRWWCGAHTLAWRGSLWRVPVPMLEVAVDRFG